LHENVHTLPFDHLWSFHFRPVSVAVSCCCFLA